MFLINRKRSWLVIWIFHSCAVYHGSLWQNGIVADYTRMCLIDIVIIELTRSTHKFWQELVCIVCVLTCERRYSHANGVPPPSGKLCPLSSFRCTSYIKSERVVDAATNAIDVVANLCLRCGIMSCIGVNGGKNGKHKRDQRWSFCLGPLLLLYRWPVKHAENYMCLHQLNVCRVKSLVLRKIDDDIGFYVRKPGLVTINYCRISSTWSYHELRNDCGTFSSPLSPIWWIEWYLFNRKWCDINVVN